MLNTQGIDRFTTTPQRIIGSATTLHTTVRVDGFHTTEVM